jgi:hypothetical protein
MKYRRFATKVSKATLEAGCGAQTTSEKSCEQQREVAIGSFFRKSVIAEGPCRIRHGYSLCAYLTHESHGHFYGRRLTPNCHPSI